MARRRKHRRHRKNPMSGQTKVVVGVGAVAAALVGVGLYEHYKEPPVSFYAILSVSGATYQAKVGQRIGVGSGASNVNSSDATVLSPNGDGTFTALKAGSSNLSGFDTTGMPTYATITVS
jgi:hypothetical protein